MSNIDHNIVILGAGPVGLFTALRLSDFDIPCVVLEAEESISEDLRASTFHPPTLDILDPYGVTDKLIELGRICPTWQIRMHETNEKAEFDLSVLKNDTAHPYRLQCEQFRLCRILIEELKNRDNVDVRFSHKLTDISQNDSKVELSVLTPNGLETMTAKYVVGADGASSTVRSKLNLSFDGMTYPETTILATTRFPFEKHIPGLSGINYAWADEGTFSLLHLPSLWRCSLYPDKDETIEDALKPEVIEKKLQRIYTKDTPYEVMDIRPYRIHMRIVDDYRVGRIILAGDAAHINSPSGGMGMNGGLHDAFFLTEAFRQIWSGANEDVLDLYTRRRRPIAFEQILKQSDANRRRMQERDPAIRRKLFEDLLGILSNPDQTYNYLLKTSMISGWRQSLETR